MLKKTLPLILLVSLFVSACGGGGDSTTATETVSTGVFIDSAVEGLHYETATQSGTTNSLGEYDYLPGETVTFSIGGILPGATSASNPVVTNIVRLLLSLDSDGDPDNGITISNEVTTAASDLAVDFSAADLSADDGITSLLNNLPTIILVSESVAQNHFSQTLAGLTNSTWGSLVWGSNTWGSDAQSVARQ